MRSREVVMGNSCHSLSAVCALSVWILGLCYLGLGCERSELVREGDVVVADAVHDSAEASDTELRDEGDARQVFAHRMLMIKL